MAEHGFGPLTSRASTVRPAASADTFGKQTWFKDATGSGAGDGTVLDASWLNHVAANLMHLCVQGGVDIDNRQDADHWVYDAVLAIAKLQALNMQPVGLDDLNDVDGEGAVPGQYLRRSADGRWRTGMPIATTIVLDPITGLTAGTVQEALQSLHTDLSSVEASLSALVAGAPGVLDTLAEIAAAVGNDPAFFTNISADVAAKLDAADYTAADVLAKLLTVDGDASGLDADTVDGVHAAALATLAALASTANGDGASLIGVEDADTWFTATDVEGVLAEIGATLDALSAGTVPDGDYGDISITGGVWSIDNGVVDNAALAAGAAVANIGYTPANATHAHAALDITSGTMATARLGSGTADGTTYLRGDQTWAAVSSGAMELIGRTNVTSSVASVVQTFTAGNYDAIIVVASDLDPASNGVGVRCALGYSGGAIITITSTDTWGTSANDSVGFVTTFMISPDSGRRHSGVMEYAGINNSTSYGGANYVNATHANAPDRITVSFSSGNIADGTITVYGLKNS